MRYTLPRPLAKTLLALGLLAPLATAIEPPSTGRVTDAELTRRIQTVLSADSVLRGRSLVVSVVDGVAVVGGPVASNEESARIGQLLKVVPDLSDVKISAWVPAIEDPLKKQIANRLKEREAPASQPNNRLVSNEPRPVARVVVQRYEPPVPALSLLNDPLPKTLSAVPARNDAAYSPLPAPAPAAPDGPPQYPTIPPPAVPVAPGQDVDSAIDAVRKGEPRFANLTVQIRSGTVTVAGSAAGAEDAWDFIAKVRKVPGVDRVVLGRMDAP